LHFTEQVGTSADASDFYSGVAFHQTTWHFILENEVFIATASRTSTPIRSKRDVTETF
jgi:hypothetical protein